ncbi:MAG TPA: hypothetical protein VG755_37920 [Nannocystaceae bacterium]|nr:hypothetical protein [Nannocystaceae bacterium]
MTRLPSLLLVLGLGFAIACASDDDDDSDSTNNTTASSQSSGMTTMSEETGEQECNSSHLCVGDACHCTTPGKEDDPCDDDMACEAQCEVCM